MNNAERELQRRNQEKERIERNNYEIPYSGTKERKLNQIVESGV